MFQHPYLTARIAEERRLDLMALAKRYRQASAARSAARASRSRVSAPRHLAWRVIRAATVAGAIAALGLAGTSSTADAATMSAPKAILMFVSSDISATSRPQLVYLTSGLPTGAVVYLQRESTTKLTWSIVKRLPGTEGSAVAPRTVPGLYQYRLLVTRLGRTLIRSAPAVLNVSPTAPSGSSGGSPAGGSAPGGSGTSWIGPVVSWLIWLLLGA